MQIQSQQFLQGSLDPDLLSWFLGSLLLLIRWLGFATLQLFAKLEVSSFIRSKHTQAVPKFKNSAPGPDRARLRVFCHV